jgi:hypothetical protein
MLKQYRWRIGIYITILTIIFLIASGVLLTVNAAPTPGISFIHVTQFDCSNFTFEGGSSPGSGYAAVRIWVNNVGGTPIVDSYVAGHPSAYFPILSNGAIGSYPQTVLFPAHPAGTTLVARVYRALSAAPNSWDQQQYIDTTINCTYGIHVVSNYVTCSQWAFYGVASPGSGYVGVRIWNNTTAIVDSYFSNFPNYYTPISSNGFFQGDVHFPPQPAGAPLRLRLYRTVNPAPGNWDSGDIKEFTMACQSIATATPFK